MLLQVGLDQLAGRVPCRTNFMKENARPIDPGQTLNRLTLLLRRLHGSMQERSGRTPTYRDIEEWTGVAEGTLKGWFGNAGQPKAEFLLQLLERVPQDARHRLLNAACRLWPTLEHPRFDLDQTTLSRLKTIVRQTRGLVLIDGGADESRTLLAAALANTFLVETERPRRVRGVDLHEPDWFVPVAGVAYLHNQFHADALGEAVTRLWSSIAVGRSLVLLNGVWSLLPAFRSRIVHLAQEHLVIVADTNAAKPAKLVKKIKGQSHFITVVEDPKAKTIRVEIVTR